MLEIIRDSILNVDQEKAPEFVTELSEVNPFTESQIESLEAERIRQSGKNGN
jgi:hypothetical protein